MLYPYIYRYELDNIIALFHPVNMATLYVDKTIITDEEALYDIINKSEFRDEWIVPNDFSYDSYVKAIIERNDSQTIDIKTLKMFITTNCNLDCAYCLIEKTLNIEALDITT